MGTVAATTVVLDHAQFIAWGRAFGAAITAPTVLALHGDLGAGKTTLVQAICAGYGVTEPVTSPTFALVHEYASARSTVRHLDLYRLDDPAQLDALGWDDLMAPDALVIVEWPERAAGRLPAETRHLHLAHVAGDPDRRALRSEG